MSEQAPRRIPFTGTVRIMLTDGRALSGAAIDLCTGGLALLSRSELAPGTLLELTFDVPTPGGPVPITCLSEVCACLFFCASRGYRVGTHFLNMSDGSRQRIRRLVYGAEAAERRRQTALRPYATGAQGLAAPHAASGRE